MMVRCSVVFNVAIKGLTAAGMSRRLHDKMISLKYELYVSHFGGIDGSLHT